MSIRIIAHLDMDAFFAAVEERDRPEMKGRSIVIGADPKGGNGRGVVSTANYSARKFGIHSAMPISEAWRLAEAGRKRSGERTVFLAGNFRKYSQVSGEIMEILKKYSESIEPASVDEAYLDLSYLKDFAHAVKTCEKIKKDIKAYERITASIGLGPNKLVAKIASDFQKPDGLTVVFPEDAESFLEPLNIRKIPGIGPKTEEILNRRGVKTVKDLKVFSEAELEFFLGKWGKELYGKARGIDDSPIVEEWEAKSIGEQETFEEDVSDPNFLMAELGNLSRNVFLRLKKEGFGKFRTIAITVRFSDFTTRTRAHTLAKESNDPESLNFEVMKLFLPFLDSRENPGKKKIRLLGVRLEKLS